MKLPTIDRELAIGYLLRFLSVEGTTGREGAIGEEIVAALREIGLPATATRYDDAHERIPLPTEAGNLIVDVPGDTSLPRRLFMAHRDTVPLAAGARPELRDDRIVSSAPTALGGDDRAGVASLVNLVATLREHDLAHPPLTLLVTVREESGLWGARHVDTGLLGEPALAFNLDGPSPGQLTIGAVGGASWSAGISGRAAHAGLHPERGISASLVAARALTLVQRRGWWGRIERASGKGSSNVGRLTGRGGGPVGDASNVVTDYALVEGEARSHDPSFLPKILAAYRRAFETAAARLPSSDGETAAIEFESGIDYEPFRLDPESDLVRFAQERSDSIGLEPTLRVADGGLDANWMTRHGLPTLTYGTGQRNVHTAEEWIDLADYLTCCRLTLTLAVQPRT